MARSSLKALLVLMVAGLVVTAFGHNISNVPKNVVMIIGDGMGFNHLYLSELLVKAKGEQAATDLFPVVGLGKNWTADGLVTDSAAAATAFFCGVITSTGAVGLDAYGNPVDSIGTFLKSRGWKVGFITNTTYYDGTPAAFYAHAKRYEVKKITEDLINAELDLFMAGGLQELGINPFTMKPRADNRIDDLVESGYLVFGPGFEQLGRPVGEYKGVMAFVALGDKSFENQLLPGEPTLPQMVERGLQYLGERRKIFLVVEAGRIDDASHINDGEAVRAELLAFQNTVSLLLASFPKDSTLFLILADHETGGLAILMGAKDGTNLSLGWTHMDHTASYVPVLAYGPGQEEFSGIYHLSEVPRKILKILQLLEAEELLEMKAR